MGKPDDISSTEKLLEMIRKNQPSLVMEAATPAHDQPSAPAATILPPVVKTIRPKKPALAIPFWPAGKAAVVGIDLQATGIGLVLAPNATTRTAPLKARFIPYDLAAPLPEAGLLPALLAADWFPPLLQKALDDFRGPHRKIAYWCALPREAVETHNITIPKVPDQEVANTIFWTAVKEIAFDQESKLLDFQTVKEVQADGGTKVLAIVYLAARAEIEGLSELCNRIGHPLTGIASPSAAFHNELRQDSLAKKDENIAHLFLGEEKSYIALFAEGRLIFRRDINTGITSLVESLMEKAADQGVILDEVGCRQLLFTEQAASKIADTWQGLITEDQTLFDLDLPAAVRLVRQMDRTLDYCKNNFAVPRASRIMLAGVPFASTALAAYFNREIGIECLIHQPIAAAGSIDDHRLLTAFGMISSDRVATQNFLQTHQQKVKKLQIDRINNAMIATTLIILLACSALFLWQKGPIHAKESQLATLLDQIGEHTPATDVQEATDSLIANLDRIKQDQEVRTTQARRFFPVAVAGEFINNLPQQIMITNLALNPGAAQPGEPAEPPQDTTMHVVLQGMVMGPRQNMEFELARYLRTLMASHIIQTARVSAKEEGRYQQQEVLRFTLDANAGLLTLATPAATD